MAVETATTQHLLDRFAHTEWTLRVDRCVAEFAGFRFLTGWFPALSGRLTLDEGLRLTLDASKPVTDPKPLARRVRSKLNAERFHEIEFASTFVTRAGRDRLLMVGELTVVGRKTVIGLQARVVKADEHAVVLHGESHVPVAEVLPGRQRRRQRDLRLTLAAEFTAPASDSASDSASEEDE